MLRIFIASKDKTSDENYGGVNVQRIHLNGILNDVNKLRGFKKYVQKCLTEGDEVLIISFIDMYFSSIKKEDNHDKLKIINTKLPESSAKLLIKEIINNKTKSLDYIEERIYSMQNMFELFLATVMGY